MAFGRISGAVLAWGPFVTLNKGTAVVEMLQSLGRRNESALRELSDALPDALAALSAEFGIDPIWQLPSAECLKLHPESSLADCASAAVLSQEPCVGASPEAPELQAPMRAWLTFANNTTPNEVVEVAAILCQHHEAICMMFACTAYFRTSNPSHS